MTAAPLALPDLAHKRVELVTGSRSGITIGVALHSSALGPGLGGCRLWRYRHWSDGLGDVLRLSSAMTLKNSLAGLDYGGGKAVIALGPDDELDDGRRRDALLDLGDLVHSFDGTYITTEDVGVTEHDMVVVRERTPHVVGLPASLGGAGEPAEGTALGVHASLEVVLERVFGSRAVADRSFVISGLGQVGSRLARRLAAAGARLHVTDIVDKRALADELGAIWIAPEQALTTAADVLVPAGLGGVLTASVIEQLPVRAVVGPANNPLAERVGAAQLAERGILYAPDFLVNAGGVIHLALMAEGATSVVLDARLRAIGDTLARVLDAAEAEGVTPLDAAEALAVERVQGAGRAGR
ncbi:MAG: Glu/Leu/Phe/Val dehydrogenase dimerization domain-containing protein [Microcella sp.]|uniref:Glu/Leu/Phe/Val dehydrogenase dimerization domain-containing protein n=1 Tax=Microcella sp. TaxID=1913979 RepID=UPI00331609E8